MSTMISEVYDALKEAGASEEKARKAAEAITSANVIADKLESNVLGIPQQAWEDGQLKHSKCCR